MNGKHPKCVITDGDLSMRNAIKRVFPTTHHRLCAWYICNNVGKNIKKNNFHKDFQNEELIAKHELHNNVWASQIFDCRSMWARSYIRGKFYADLHTTSRCEGLHSQMGRYIESGYNVTEFLHHFQRCLSYMRNNEVVEDFKSLYGDELLQTPYHNLEGYASSIYTRVVFKEFRKILLEAAKLRIISSQQTSSHAICKIWKHYSPNKKCHVSHYDNGSNVDIKCSCRRIESFGMPCSHNIFLLLVLDRPKTHFRVRTSKRRERRAFQEQGALGLILELEKSRPARCGMDDELDLPDVNLGPYNPSIIQSTFNHSNHNKKSILQVHIPKSIPRRQVKIHTTKAGQNPYHEGRSKSIPRRQVKIHTTKEDQNPYHEGRSKSIPRRHVKHIIHISRTNAVK
ncbi:hypothetical protein Lal_00018884 [Lupinus albus]|nr:hypothetical protein Lal_00018884 [Lupinus albus]